MALYDFVRAITKSALMVHLKNIPKDVYKWRKDLLDAVVTKEELLDWMEQGGVDHGNLTGLTDDDHTQYILASGTRALTGNWDAGSFEIRAQTLESDVTTGTAPLTIASTTKVTNLNSDLLDDQTGSYYLDSANFTGTSWTDLTDGGATTLHKHDHGGQDGLADDDHTQYVLRSQWKQNGFISASDITITWSDANRKLSVAKTGSNFAYFEAGVLYTKTTTQEVVIDDTEGLWIIYFDGATLTAVNSPSDTDIEHIIENHTIVAYVYWDATNNLGKMFAEPHGSSMAPMTHHYLHDVFGAQYDSGMALGDILADEDGSSDTHAQFSTEAGYFYDEDVKHTIEATASNVGLEIYYFDGSDLRWTTNAGFSFINGGTGRIMYNNAGSQTEVGNTKFVLAHVFATNIKDADGTNGRLIAIQGQAQYDTIALARDGADTEINNLITGDLPLQEILPVATVILQTADAYTNAVNARIRSTSTGDDYVDWRTSLRSGGGASTTNDHGLLSGLADDDHTQYLLADGTRGLSADWDAGTWEIRANTFESDVATGTAPLVVASTTKVTNLNAEFFDGLSIEGTPASDVGEFITFYDTGSNIGIIGSGFSSSNFISPLLIIDSSAFTITVLNDTEGNIPAGSLCYITGISSGTLTVDLADADSEAKSSGMLVIATGGISAAESGVAVIWGYVGSRTGLTAGNKLYVSTTDGAITATAPSGTGDIVRIVGYALSATEMFFKPDNTYVEVA